MDTGREIFAKFVAAVDFACLMGGCKLRFTAADGPGI
jgi:hypothetical protein